MKFRYSYFISGGALLRELPHNTEVLRGHTQLVTAAIFSKGVASPTPASWNQIASWLQQIDGLRRAA